MQLAGLQKELHREEGLWLHCKDLDGRRMLREGYLEKGSTFKRAVRKARELGEPESVEIKRLAKEMVDVVYWV